MENKEYPNDVNTIELNNLTISDSESENDIVNQKDEHGYTPLIHTIYSNNLEIMRTLLENGADVNKTDGSGRSPIFHAIYRNNLEIMQMLLENGADINKTDDNGESPIFHAIFKNYKLYEYDLKKFKHYGYSIQTVNFLLKYGANLDDINKKERFDLLCEASRDKKNNSAHLARILIKDSKNKINKKTDI